MNLVADSSLGNFEIGISSIGELFISPVLSSDNAPVTTPSVQTHYTLLLDTITHDLVIDSFSNIAVCSQPYATAQDVGTALRLCLGELWYDTKKGVPFFQKIAGKPLPLALLKSYLEAAAMTVPDVVKASVTFSTFTNRHVIGQLLFTDTNGQTHGVKL
jgi:hypothetical protein